MKHTILLIVILAGYLWTDAAEAAEGSFFFNATVDYQIDSMSDELIQTGCHFAGPTRICTGRNPRNELSAGYEFAFGDFRNRWYLPVIQVGYKHRSGIRDGAPFNNNPEIYQDLIFLGFKFGGLR